MSDLKLMYRRKNLFVAVSPRNPITDSAYFIYVIKSRMYQLEATVMQKLACAINGS